MRSREMNGRMSSKLRPCCQYKYILYSDVDHKLV